MFNISYIENFLKHTKTRNISVRGFPLNVCFAARYQDVLHPVCTHKIRVKLQSHLHTTMRNAKAVALCLARFRRSTLEYKLLCTENVSIRSFPLNAADAKTAEIFNIMYKLHNPCM